MVSGQENVTVVRGSWLVKGLHREKYRRCAIREKGAKAAEYREGGDTLRYKTFESCGFAERATVLVKNTGRGGGINPPLRCYSYLSAAMGSTRVARFAGM